jgi:hypothetical protein
VEDYENLCAHEIVDGEVLEKVVPFQLIKTIRFCITGKRAVTGREPTRNTIAGYKRLVFDWLKKVKQIGKIDSGLIRKNLRDMLKESDLTKLGVLDLVMAHQEVEPTNSVQLVSVAHSPEEKTLGK